MVLKDIMEMEDMQQVLSSIIPMELQFPQLVKFTLLIMAIIVLE
jgi:hypothetical protein